MCGCVRHRSSKGLCTCSCRDHRHLRVTRNIAPAPTRPPPLRRRGRRSGSAGDVESIRAVLASHFVMWRDLNDLAGPSGEWFCECGETFGFSDSAIDHVAAFLAAHVARASTAGRERVARAVIGALKPYGFGAAAIADRLRAALAAPHVEPVDG